MIKVFGIFCIIAGLCLVAWGGKNLKNAPRPGTVGEFGAILCFATSVAILILSGITLLLL